MGALHYALGHYHQAETCFSRALRTIDDEVEKGEVEFEPSKVVLIIPLHPFPPHPFQLTCLYNLARVSESLKDFERAEKLYKNIIRQNAKYIECYMRLGVMARDRGQLHDASTWWKEALSINLVKNECNLRELPLF